MMIGLLIGIAVGGILVVAQRESIGRKEVARLVERGGLPADADLVATAEGWFRRRQIMLVVGTWIGVAVAGGVLLVTGRDANSALNWSVMAAVVGFGIGLCILHLRAMRSAQHDGPRAATLRPRRLSDYLTGPEIVLQYAILVLPLVSVALGVLVLTGDDRPASGWGLVVGGLSAFPFAAVGTYLQHRMLQLNQPADSENALRWREALRASVLRDLGGIVMGAGWLFGPALVFSFEWPAGVPGFVEPLSYAMFSGGTLLVAGVTALAYTKRGLRRSQRVVEG